MMGVWRVAFCAMVSWGLAGCASCGGETSPGEDAGAGADTGGEDAGGDASVEPRRTFACGEPLRGTVRLAPETAERFGAATVRYGIDPVMNSVNVALVTEDEESAGEFTYSISNATGVLESPTGGRFDITSEEIRAEAPNIGLLTSMSDERGVVMRMRAIVEIEDERTFLPRRIEDMWLEAPAEFEGEQASSLLDADGTKWTVWPMYASARVFETSASGDAWIEGLALEERLGDVSYSPFFALVEPEVASVMLAHVRACAAEEEETELVGAGVTSACLGSSLRASNTSACKGVDTFISRSLAVAGIAASLVSFGFGWREFFKAGASGNLVNINSSSWDVFWGFKFITYDSIVFGKSVEGWKADSGGDPHIRTFDGLSYDFQSIGEYVALSDVDDPEFEVQVRHSAWSSDACSGVSANESLALRFAGHEIVFDANDEHPELLVDGVPVDELTGSLPELEQGYSVYEGFGLFRLTWPDGRRVEVGMRSGWLNYEITVTEQQRGRLRGIFGDFDGDPLDDLVGVDGPLGAVITPSDLYVDFSDAHRLEQARSMLYYADGEDTQTYTDRAFPVITDTSDALSPDAYAGALEVCTEAGVADVWMESCVLDVGCMLEDDAVEFFQSREEPEVRLGLVDSPPVVEGDAASIGAPESVLEGDLSSDLHAFVFEETKALTLEARVEVDLVVPGSLGPGQPDQPDSFVESGTSIRSHYVHLDPTYTTRSPRRFSVTFATPVVGVVASAERLGASDALFGARGTVYPMRGDRGFEHSESDRITLSDDRYTVTFELSESDALDGARILTVAPSGAQEMP